MNNLPTYKIEVMGGRLNGAERYYKSLKGAKIAAHRVGQTTQERILTGWRVFVDIYEVNNKGQKKLIETIMY